MASLKDNKILISNMKKDIEAYLQKDELDQYYAIFEGRVIYSVFQPILRWKADGVECVGHEALFRLGDSLAPKSPLGFLSYLAEEKRYLFDRMLRALHLRNFVQGGERNKAIFLNVDPGTYYDQRLMNNGFELLVNRLQAIGLDPQKLVFEFTEMPSVNELILKESIVKLKEIGVRVAIDDYGVAHSSFERVKILEPDIVKFDRSWLLNAHEFKSSEDSFIENVKEIRDLGIEVLVEGVEFDYDLKMVDLINPDYVQGYWYGKPQKTL